MSARVPLASALAAALAAGALTLVARGALADERALPADVEPSRGMPPWTPGPEVRGAAALEAWAERVTLLAQASPDPTRRAELLLSAAAALRPGPDGTRRAARLALEAHNALPWQDPLAALALIETLEGWLALGAFEPARPALARLRDWRALPGPVDPDARTLERWRLAQERARERFPVLTAALHEGLGQPAEAADALLALVADARPEQQAALAPVWERVARLRFSAGQAEPARAATERALAWALDPALVARLSFWRLHLEHGLLRRDGALGPAMDPTERRALRPPGEPYLAALEELVQRLRGNPEVGGHLLSAASSALLLGRDDTALRVYRLALDDPHLRRQVWHDAALWGGLLPGVEAALRLGRLDEAAALLGEIELLAGEAVPQADPLRVRIALARRRQEQQATRAAPTPREPERERPARPSGVLRVPGVEERPPEHAPAAGPTSEESADDGGVWGGLAAALAAALALGLAWRRRRAA